MMKCKTRMKLMTALVPLMLGSSLGWSCTTDMHDALLSGVMDYVTSNTTDALNCVFTAEGCWDKEE